ncbi:MAG: hypothetical protein AAF355_09150 [Myxococcota bacterium]
MNLHTPTSCKPSSGRVEHPNQLELEDYITEKELGTCKKPLAKSAPGTTRPKRGCLKAKRQGPSTI